ncbi:MAG: hypothetical protein V1755_00575, partial [Chloroflexota bacterium]
MSWDDAEAKLKKHDGAGPFVRLAENGDKVVGAFVGEAYAREVVWNGQGFDPAAEGEKSSLRVAVNFFVPGVGMKIIEGGSVWFKDVIKVRAKYGLDKMCFEIQRHGGKG